MVGRPRVFGGEHVAEREMQVDRACQRGEDGVEGGFESGGGLLEACPEKFEADVARFREQIAKAHHEQRAVPAFGPVTAECDDTPGEECG